MFPLWGTGGRLFRCVGLPKAAEHLLLAALFFVLSCVQAKERTTIPHLQRSAALKKVVYVHSFACAKE